MLRSQEKHEPLSLCPRGQCPNSGCDCGYELPEERQAHSHTKIVTAQVLRAAYVAGRFQEAITHAVELHANGSYQRVLCNRVRLENLTEAADESLTPTCRRCQRILTKKLTTTEKIPLTPHQRIMRAAKHKTGIRFSADEVQIIATNAGMGAYTPSNDTDQYALSPSEKD